MSWSNMLTFAEAFLTVEIAGLGGIMITGAAPGGAAATAVAAGLASGYVWPSLPALVFISLGAFLAGIRRLNSLHTN